MVDAAVTRAAVEAVWRVEAARLLGGLVRFIGDVDRAEDLAQEALLQALSRWPVSGIPDNPGAWLMTTAKHRAIDEGRKRLRHGDKEDALAFAADAGHAERAAHRDAAVDAALDEEVGDDVLRLVLLACHPVLSREARVALTLRLVAGLTTAEIARALLTAEPTVAQRIVRAKRTLTEARVPFVVPQGAALRERVPPALEVLYLIFNEGYAATAGADLTRPALCDEAMRLARVLVAQVPDDAEAHGLLALLELQGSRLRARVDARGDAVLLLDQDRARWDWLLIHRGERSLEVATRLSDAAGQGLGVYTLQAAIAACHARARVAADTDWARIVALYDALVERTGSPVVELNRAVAVAMAFGPAEGLTLVDELTADPALADYAMLPAARGEMLSRLGRHDDARRAFERAAALTHNERERALLLSRAAACSEALP